MFAFEEVKRKANKFVQFEFHEEAVVTGMIVTTYKDFGLKSFRLRANNDLNSPELLTVEDPIASVVKNIKSYYLRSHIFNFSLSTCVG